MFFWLLIQKPQNYLIIPNDAVFLGMTCEQAIQKLWFIRWLTFYKACTVNKILFFFFLLSSFHVHWCICSYMGAKLMWYKFNHCFYYNLHSRALHQQQFIDPPGTFFTDEKAKDWMEIYSRSRNKSTPFYFGPVPWQHFLFLLLVKEHVLQHFYYCSTFVTQTLLLVLLAL